MPDYQVTPEATARAEETLKALLERSTTDTAFRAKLLNEPKAALAEFAGRDPNAENAWPVNVAFVENKADVTIVLPNVVDVAAELSERELETVAGGSDLLLTAIAVTLAIDGGLLSYAIAKR